MAALLDPRQNKRLVKFGIASTEIRKAETWVMLESRANPSIVQQQYPHRNIRKKQKIMTGSIIIEAANLCSSDESDEEVPVGIYRSEEEEFTSYLHRNLDKGDRSNFVLLQ